MAGLLLAIGAEVELIDSVGNEVGWVETVGVIALVRDDVVEKEAELEVDGKGEEEGEDV